MTIASTPRCGREPWAARPHTSISDHTKPLCAIDELELGRLGDDRRVGAERLQHLLHTKARVLLVGHRGHDHVAGEIEARRPPGRRSTPRRARPSCRRRRARRAGRLRSAARAGRASPPRSPCRRCPHSSSDRPRRLPRRSNDDARPSRGRLEDLDLQTGRTSPVGDVRGDLAFAGATGDQRGVDGVDRDHAGEQIKHGVRHAESVSLPR